MASAGFDRLICKLQQIWTYSGCIGFNNNIIQGHQLWTADCSVGKFALSELPDIHIVKFSH